MVIRLPYQLQEGTIAYAAKVMANFEAVLAGLNIITINGDTGDLESVLNTLFKDMIEREVGNSQDILFEDGESLQSKFDSGKTTLGVLTGQGMFYFYVAEDGHLKVVTNGNIDEEDFSLNEEGHLIYTVSDLEGSTAPVEYDLGLVRGTKGDSGAQGPAGSTDHYFGIYTCSGWDNVYLLTEDLIFSSGKTYYTLANGVYSPATVTPGEAVAANTYYEQFQQVKITDADKISGDNLSLALTETSGTYVFKPSETISPSNISSAWDTWVNGKIISVKQGVENGVGYITLQALGEMPSGSILLDIDMWKRRV